MAEVDSILELHKPEPSRQSLAADSSVSELSHQSVAQLKKKQ